MLPNAIVIKEAIKRNDISLESLAHSIFRDKANDFIAFIHSKDSTKQSLSHSVSLKLGYKNLLQLAEKLDIPFGYLFLQEMPKENTKIAELRRKNPKSKISQVLKESIKNSEYKQLWYRDYLIEIGQEAQYNKKFDNEKEVIEKIKLMLYFNTLPKNPYKALNQMIERLQDKNFLIFIATRINRSNSKKLDIEDFRGYCLYDKYAPVIFLNNQDSYKGKIFTLLHELAHILYGKNGIILLDNEHHQELEKTCNFIAGEILIPKYLLLEQWDKKLNVSQNVDSLKDIFKLASDEAIATKAINLKLISQEQYEEYIEECKAKPKKKPYSPNNDKKVFKSIIKENSKNFVEAIVAQTYNNKLDFKTAMDYLGIKEIKYFRGIQEEIGL
ncbi:ImmA/IrrE family metallo-endopeptidase [uncultured Helicobacter sp.]|uniref:ImmA/IrrE family metallo-endopeptidase n=1 Tax=uncultured Helicobacter sp. TaxID=175537 RepID=UPI002630B4FE|nr:ImmA/IrrE family metallo-endopeptidase [uncultured Helicobacter sp.]